MVPEDLARFAIDGKAPRSDLYVSTAHASGVLMPASNLVNGVTIVADAKPEALSLTFFHIAWDTHEAILAEGFTVESFQRDNVHAFDNADDYVRLYGPPGEPLAPFAPIISYNGSCQELASYIPSALAPLHNAIEKVRCRSPRLCPCWPLAAKQCAPLTSFLQALDLARAEGESLWISETIGPGAFARSRLPGTQAIGGARRAARPAPTKKASAPRRTAPKAYNIVTYMLQYRYTGIIMCGTERERVGRPTS